MKFLKILLCTGFLLNAHALCAQKKTSYPLKEDPRQLLPIFGVSLDKDEVLFLQKLQEESRRHSLALQWGVYIPLDGGFLNHAAAVSPALEWDWRISDTFSIGAEAGYIRGSERGFTEDRYEGDLVTGLSDRRLTLIPLTAHLRWVPVTFLRHRLRPFIGAGIGAQYAEFRIEGDLINKSQINSWGAVVRPEAGIGFAPRQNGRICIEVKCGWQYASNKFTIMNVQSLQGVQVSASVRYRF